MLLQTKQTTYLLKNELNELSKKVESISTKELTKDLINRKKFLMTENIFLQDYFKII